MPKIAIIVFGIAFILLTSCKPAPESRSSSWENGKNLKLAEKALAKSKIKGISVSQVYDKNTQSGKIKLDGTTATLEEAIEISKTLEIFSKRHGIDIANNIDSLFPHPPIEERAGLSQIRNILQKNLSENNISNRLSVKYGKSSYFNYMKDGELETFTIPLEVEITGYLSVPFGKEVLVEYLTEYCVGMECPVFSIYVSNDLNYRPPMKSEKREYRASLLNPNDVSDCDTRILRNSESNIRLVSEDCDYKFKEADRCYKLEKTNFPAGSEFCLSTITPKHYWEAYVRTNVEVDAIVGRNNLLEPEVYAMDDLKQNCEPTLRRMIEQRGPRINVPSDPSAKYFLLGKTVKNSLGHLEITTHRFGKSGQSISTREINCYNKTFQYQGDGDTIGDYCGAGYDGILRPMTKGSISEHIAMYACSNY